MDWSDLTIAQRANLFERRYAQGEDISTLAQEIGINPISLNRRLQEMREDPEETPEDKLEVSSTDANNMTVSSQSERITSLDDLLKQCGIDLDVWSVDHWIANTWEGYRKGETKSITWDGGVMTGEVEDTGTLVTKTLYQIKAWLVRNEPVPVAPVISPVVIAPERLVVASGDREPSGVNRTLVIPDTHFGFRRDGIGIVPFHDRAALSIVLQVAAIGEYSDIVLLGDGLDLPEWSDKFISGPDFAQLTQPALDEMAWFLWNLRTAQPTARISYIEGNHEKRLRDMVIRHIPQAYGLKPVGTSLDFSAWSVPQLLGLDAMSIQWVGGYPDGLVWITDDLVAMHGAALSADKVVSDMDVSVIFGHIHRHDVSSRTVYDKNGARVITAYSPGFLGRLDGVVPGVKGRQRWSQGFAVVTHLPGFSANIQHVAITNGCAIFDGALVQGTDYSDQLPTKKTV